MKISHFSIRRPVFTLVTMILALVLGVVSLANIPLKLIPDINPPIGAVVTAFPGASPTEVLEKVTKPLESQLSTVPGLRTMSSSSQEGASLIILELNWDKTLDQAESDIMSRINQIALPEGAERSRLLKFDPSQFPVIQVALTGGAEVERLNEVVRSLQQKLSQVDGVASVDASGLLIDEIQIRLDQERLREYGITQAEIADILRANHISLPGEPVLSQEQELTTRVISALTSLEDIRNVVLTVDPATGNDVTVASVGSVAVAPQDQPSLTRLNQKPAILLSVLQQSDANTASVSAAFKQRLEELLDATEYQDVGAVVINDQGDYVKLAIGSMTNVLALGALLAMVVLFFFLRNVRSPLIVGIAIPYSVIVTFVLMYFANFTLNIMSLGGLALGIGMLVDNSIVVIENINRHLAMGKDPKEAAKEGASEVGSAITASTLTTVAVFLPIVFTTGIVGNLFKEFSFTIAFSLFSSLFVALTVVPMLASRLLSASAPRRGKAASRPEKSGMRGAVRWALHHRFAVIALTLALLAGSLFGLTTLGMEFLPATDEGFFTIDVELEEGATLDETEEVVGRMETYLESRQAAGDYLSLVGTTQDAAYQAGGASNRAQILVKMVDPSERTVTTPRFMDAISRDIRQLAPDASVSFSMQASTGTQPNTLTFMVRDADEARLDDAVARIHDALQAVGQLHEITSTASETVEEVQMTVDRERALRHGLVPAQIAMLVSGVTRGEHVMQITTDAFDVYSVRIGYRPDQVNTTDQLRKLWIRGPDGTYITLESIADFARGVGPSVIQRTDQERAVQFTLKYEANANLGDISSRVQEEIDKLSLPEDTIVSFTGDTEILSSAVSDLTFAILLAILFVYLVMAAQFESLKHPLIIMVSIPLVIVGVAVALVATQTPISVTALIGLLVLAGIVVNNAIVLVDYILQMKAKGTPTYDAIVETVNIRTRPILMTSLTTILGLLPLALGWGEGTEMQQPMGITVIGGLVSSTLLTLFFIPVVFSLFDKETRRLSKRKDGGEPRKKEGEDDVMERLQELSKEELLTLIESVKRR